MASSRDHAADPDDGLRAWLRAWAKDHPRRGFHPAYHDARAGVARRAKQSAAQANGPRTAGGSYVVEVTKQTFEAETIRKSLKHPVVVELYSPRVATGQQLSAALIEIANAADGKFLLARLNVDAAPGIVQALGLQAVRRLINGQLAPLFQGVLAKDQVQAAIDQLLKAAVSSGMVGRAEPVGAESSAAAEPEPEADPRYAAADAALERGDFAAAREELDKLLQANPMMLGHRLARRRRACSPVRRCLILSRPLLPQWQR